jgi:hypothetical protein
MNLENLHIAYIQLLRYERFKPIEIGSILVYRNIALGMVKVTAIISNTPQEALII